MNKNSNLNTAKKEKNDEFYTLYSDVEKEVEEYKTQLEDKIIFCNCDDPEQSNFWKYLSNNFHYYKLKKLISSHYDANGNSYKLEISRDINNDGSVDKLDTQKIPFKGDGDFRSEECIEILKECDIVITNPPFSLFREYIAQLMEYDKKFLVIGSYNAITYKEVFTYIKANRLWIGVSPRSMNFMRSDGSEDVVNACWFTNLDNKKRHIDLVRNVLYKKYTPEEYSTYDNYDAINVDKVKEIPEDYFGYIGVPITYLCNHNPDQFEIIGLGISNSGIEFGVRPYTQEHKKYRKEIQKRGAVDGDLYMITNGIVDVPYARIVIKRK